MTDVTNATVMYAIFAMDAYEHNPNDGSWSQDLTKFFPDLQAGLLGSYALQAVSTESESTNNNFFAIAYTSVSGTIISYRGTSALFGTNFLNGDINNGYGVGAGSPDGPDAANAVSFYQNVAALNNSPLEGASNITVVGHSLGGGLAGFVGAIYGLQGVLFDNMTFNNAASRAYSQTFPFRTEDGIEISGHGAELFYGSQSPYPNNLSRLSAFATTGELLSIILPLRAFQTPPVQYLDSYGGPRGILDLHSMSLLTLLVYAQANNKTAWHSVGVQLINALYDNRLGSAIVGNGSDANLVRTIIAYSAINAGYEPFGTTAIQSLFEDADTLGGIQSAGHFTGWLLPAPTAEAAGAVTPVGALAEIAVQFAGDQAAAASTDQDLAQGALELDGSVLKVDLDPREWVSTFATPASTTTTAIVGLGDFFDGVLSNISAGISSMDPTSSWIASTAAGFSSSLLKQLNEITEVDIALGAGDLSAAGTLPTAHDGTPGGAMLIGTYGQGAITGSTQGNDVIVGGNTITAGNGNDIILAGGTETITVGTGKNQILSDSPDMNVTLTYAGGAVGASGGGAAAGESGGPPPAIASEGTDVIIGNSAGGDTFTFTDAERAAFTVVWGGSGNDTFNIDTSSSSDVNVVELDMSGISGGNLTNLDATKLENDVDQKYGLNSSQATLVILNPSTSDTISYNGKTVETPAVTLSDTFWDNSFSTGNIAPPSFSVPWTSVFSESGSSSVLASTNFAFGYNLTNASTREVSLQPIVQKVITTGGVSVVNSSSYQRFAEFGTTYLSPTSAAALNLINYNPGDFGIGVPEDGTSFEGIQKETLYDQFGAVLSNSTKQFGPFSLYDPSFLDPSRNRPTINLADFLSGTSATDPTGVSTAFFAANQGLLDGQFYGFTVLDTAANVSSALDALNADSKLTGITLTDSGTPTLTLTISQASNDTAALGEITNASYDIAIADASADVSQAIDALNADVTVTSIHLTDAGTPSLTLTAMQALQDTTALAKISNASYTIAISDTAADVAFNIDALNSDIAVSSVTLTDSGTPVLALTVAQILDDTTVLGEITNAAYGITVEDTAANILANASALSSDGHVTGAIVVDTAANVLDNADALNADGLVTSITVVDTAANILADMTSIQAAAKITSLVVVDTAANVLANASALASVTEITGIGVADTAADVAANIDALNADSSIGSVDFTDSGTPTLALTAAQAVNDTSLLAKIAIPYVIDVADTAAAIAENIDALAEVATLASVTLTDPGTPILTLTTAQAVSDVGVIAMISNTNAEIVISDTAANVVAQLDALNADSKITAITLTDTGTPTLTLTVAQAVGDATALGKISNANVRIVVSDTAADVSANFDVLNADATLSSITLTDGDTPMLLLTAAQAADDTGLLAKISNSNYTITIFDSVSNILADAGSLASDGKVSSINAVDTVANILGDSAALVSAGSTSLLISDTAANVAANFDAIKADSSVRAISLTDSGTPTLSLTVSQAINDAETLGIITNATFAIDISGTAADVAANINFLAANDFVAAVTLTDSGTPTLSLNAGEAIGDAAFLAKITNASYVLDIADTAAAVSANLDALNTDAAVSAITLTDPGTPVLNLSVAQALDDTSALGLITNANYTIAITDTAANVVTNAAALAGDARISSISVVDNAANVLAADASLTSNPLLASITVVDTAANVVADEGALASEPNISAVEVVDSAADVAANFDALNTDGAVSTITLTDANPVLTLTAEQAANDFSAFNEITNSSYSIVVVDTAADVSQYLSRLAFNQNLTSITLTDSGTPTLDLYSYELGSGVLSKITNSDYTVSVLDSSAVSVSTFVTGQAVLDASPGGFSISDTAADVSAQIDALNADTNLTSITLTDGGTPNLALSSAQLVNDTQALDKIINSDYTIAITDTVANILAGGEIFAGNAHITSLVVQDTAANVLANAAALEADSGVTAIIVVDTAANTSANEAALSALTVPVTVEVEDSAADVSALIDQLNADASLSSIMLTDATNPTLTLTVGQAVNDSNALGKIAGPSPFVPATYGIAIADTAANVSGNIDALSNISQISSISLTDSQQLSLTLDATDALADQGVLGTLSNATYSVAVVDTAANIQTDIDGLGFDPNISSITVQDADVINVTAEQAAQDAAVLGKLVNATVNVVNTMNISVAEFLSEQSAIDSIPANFSILDAAANVSTVLAALNTDPNLAAITLSDSGVPTLTLTATQALQSSVALGEITNSSYAIAISDTAANVAANFDALNSDGNVASITFTDSGVPTLALTAAQVDNDTNALSKISSEPYVLSITGTGSEGINIAQPLQLSNFAYDATNGDWQVDGDNLADKLTNVASVVDSNGQRFLLVGGGSEYATADAAVAAASNGDIILLTPGSDPGSVGTDGKTITIEDVSAVGNTQPPSVTITSAAEASNVASQTITGTVTSGGAATVVGQTVTITDNGATLGTATVQSDGSFSANVALPNQGTNLIVASVTDSNGNTGSSGAVVDTLDNVAPTVTITSQAEASDVASQTIAGTVTSGGAAAVLGQTVTLTDNGTTLGTATVQSDGTFSANVTLPNQGSNSIVATVTDSFGNTGSSAAVVDTLDNVAPTVTITSAAESGNVASQTITGTVASGGAATVVGQVVTLTDNGTTLGTATVQSDGTFSVNVTLPNQGSNSIVAAVTDSFGNVGTSTAVVDTLDTVAPTVTITSAAEASNVANQTITGTVASGGAATVVGQTVTLTDNGTTLGTGTVQSDGTFSVSVTLPDQGANSIVATVTDSFGNTGSSAAVVDTFDNVAPTVTIGNTAGATNNANQTITGTVVSGGAATVVGQTVTLTDNGTSLGTAIVQSNGTFSASVTLPNQGTNAIVATVTDGFGNTGSSAALTYTLDSTPPTVTITSAAEASKNASQTITGTVTSGGAATVVGQTVTLTDNGTTLGTATVQSNGTFSASVTLPNQGSNSIVATVTDSFGNNGSSAAVVDTLDSVAPTVTITSAAEASKNTSQTITGTVASGGAAAVVGQTVTLTDNGTALGAAAVQSNGTFSANVTLPNEGANSIVATVTDSFGNTGTSATIIDTLDNIPPTVTITSAAETSNTASQTITGSVTSGGAAAIIGQTVTLTDNGTTLGTATVQANGTFSDSVTLAVPGTNSIVATVADSVGNAGSSAAVVDTLAATTSASNTTISLSNGSGLIVNGTGDTVSVNSGWVELNDPNGRVTVNGSSDAVLVVSSGSSATITGNSETVSLNGSTDAATLTGTGDTVSANNATLTLNSGSMTVSGSDTINLNGVGDILGLSGTGATETVTLAPATTAAIASSSPYVINGSSDTLSISLPGTKSGTNFADLIVNGSGNTLSFSDGSSGAAASAGITVNGNNDALSVTNNNSGSNPATVSISGTGDSVTVSAASLTLASSSSASLTGSNDSITIVSGDSLSISGTGDTVNGNGASVSVAAGSSATVTGSDEDLSVGGGSSTSTLTLGGNDDVVQAAAGSTFTISATSGSANVNDLETVAFGNTTNSVTLANGSGTITIVGVESVTPAITGTTGNDTITGTTGNDIIDGKGGVDSEQGNGGDDTYVFRKGYGQLTINNFSSANNNSLGTLSFDSSIAPSNVTIARGGANFGDLILSVPSTSDQVTVSGAFAASTNGLRQVLFANGTSWNMSFLAAQAGYDANVNGSSNTISASNAAFVDVTANNATVTVTGSNDPTTVGGTNDTVVVSSSNDTITTTNAASITVTGTNSSASIAGNGNAVSVAGSSDQVMLNGNSEIVSISGNNNAITASGTNETYLASSGAGQVTINNATSSSSAAQGQLDFSSGITDENLWFVQNGNNLNIDVMGTQNQFTIANWFGSNPAASLAEIVDGSGLKLDSAVSQLVQAMATYSADNPGFSPTAVSQAPADSNLQSAISAAWH